MPRSDPPHGLWQGHSRPDDGPSGDQVPDRPQYARQSGPVDPPANCGGRGSGQHGRRAEQRDWRDYPHADCRGSAAVLDPVRGPAGSGRPRLPGRGKDAAHGHFQGLPGPRRRGPSVHDPERRSGAAFVLSGPDRADRPPIRRQHQAVFPGPAAPSRAAPGQADDPAPAQ